MRVYLDNNVLVDIEQGKMTCPDPSWDNLDKLAPS